MTLKQIKRPGQFLSFLLQATTGEAPCQNCMHHARVMNKNGWLWCWQHRAEIVGWLIVEAKKRGYEVKEDTAAQLVFSYFNSLRDKVVQ